MHIQNVPFSKCPTLKTSHSQNVPSLNVPRTKRPTAQNVPLSKHPTLKTSHSQNVPRTKRPMAQNVPKKRPTAQNVPQKTSHGTKHPPQIHSVIICRQKILNDPANIAFIHTLLGKIVELYTVCSESSNISLVVLDSLKAKNNCPKLYMCSESSNISLVGS
jgi:hypothetical protein